MTNEMEVVGGVPATGRTGVFSSRHLWVHAVLLAVMLAVLVPFVDNGTVGFADEALYSMQAANLAEGSWAQPRPAVDLDRNGTLSAVIGSTAVGNDSIPYVQHPLYPLLLTPFYWAGGVAGMLALSAFGTWLAALTGALIARRLNPRYTVATLWILGIGSPLLFDSIVVLPHSVAAALAGVTTLATLAAIRPRLTSPDLGDDAELSDIPRRTARRYRWLALALPAAACLVMVRSEGVLLAAALALVLGLQSLRLRARHLIIDWPAALIATALAGIGAAAYLYDLHWANSILHSSATTGELIAGHEPNPLTAAWADLLRPWGTYYPITVELTLVMVAAIAAPLLLRLVPRFTLLPLALVVVGAGAGVAYLFDTPDPVSGLLTAFPLLSVGLLLLARPTLSQRLSVTLLATTLLTTAGILATSYGTGGATQWGGRFFHVALPLAVPLAVAGLDHARVRLDLASQRIGIAALIVLTLTLSITAIRTNVESRWRIRSLVNGTVDFAADHATTRDPLIMCAPYTPSGTCRFFWRAVSEGHQLIGSPGIGTTLPLLSYVRASGRKEVVMTINLDPQSVSELLGRVRNDRWWRVAEVRQLEGIPWYAIRLVATG